MTRRTVRSVETYRGFRLYRPLLTKEKRVVDNPSEKDVDDSSQFVSCGKGGTITAVASAPGMKTLDLH